MHPPYKIPRRSIGLFRPQRGKFKTNGCSFGFHDTVWKYVHPSFIRPKGLLTGQQGAHSSPKRQVSEYVFPSPGVAGQQRGTGLTNRGSETKPCKLRNKPAMIAFRAITSPSKYSQSGSYCYRDTPPTPSFRPHGLHVNADGCSCY